MSSQAPTLNRMAISPQRASLGQQPPARPPGQSAPASVERERIVTAERQRVAAAVDFGAALENLVAYARLRQGEPDAAPRESESPFPPDLLVRRDPEDLLRSTCQKLLKLEPTLLGLDRPGGMMPPPGPRNLDKPPTSNGHPVSAIPSSSGEPSALEGTSTPKGPLSPDEPSTEPPEETMPPPESSTPEMLSTSNGTSSPERAPIEQPNGTGPSPSTGNPPPERPPIPPRPQAPPKLPTPVGPSRELKIKEKIDALLRVSAQGDSRDLEHRLANLDKAIWEWNEDIVEHIVDSPAVLSAYRVGKALSLTRWRIWVAKHWNQGNGDLSVGPWEKAFGKERVDEIQRHVNALSTVLDPQAVTAVATGLGYWRNALLSLSTTEGSSSTRPRSWWRNALLNLASIGESSSNRSRSSQLPSPQTIKVSPKHGDKLLVALEEQLANWLDLLTGRRPPESFPVAGIVTTLTKKMAADLWSRLFRFLIPVVAGVAVLVIVGGLGVAGYMVLSTAPTDAGSEDPKGLLGSLGTAVGGVITFLAVQGRSLLGRGAANGASWGRNGRGGMYNNGAFPRSNYGVAAAAGVVADLQRDVLSGVVDQLKVEELNLAVSEPLMRCVLAFHDRESKKDDPLKDAERFLRLIYRDKSNLDRLRPVFKDLYKHQ